MADRMKINVFGCSDTKMIDTIHATLLSLPAADIGVFSSPKYAVFPGFCDVHVHFREPGFSYKETIASGCAAAARGGYTAVCTMPNLNPVPDSAEHLKEQTDLIDRNATIGVYPYASITVGQKGEALSDFSTMCDRAIAFSDDGRGVQDEDLMRAAMIEAKRLGKMIVAHCEDNSLLHGGYIHDGDYAKAHGHRGICSESEWGPIARDLKLAKETGCAYHVCHISTKESVELIRAAKAEGVDVTCETAPHYLDIQRAMMVTPRGHPNICFFNCVTQLLIAHSTDAVCVGLLDEMRTFLFACFPTHSARIILLAVYA